MFTAVLGTPSPLTHWTLHAVRIAMDTFLGGHAPVHADTPEAFRAERRKSGVATEKTVLVSTAPGRALCEFLLRSKAPVIIANDAAFDCAAFAVPTYTMPPDNALREYLKSSATLYAMLGSRAVIRVTPEDYTETLARFLEKLVAGWRLDCGAPQFAAIIAYAAGDHAQGGNAPVEDLILRDVAHARKRGGYTTLDAEHAARASRLEADCAPLWDRAVMNQLRCPSAWYFADGKPYGPADAWHRLTGPARCFLWGPSIHLPAGKWNVRCRIALRENFSGNLLRVEVRHAGIPQENFDAELPESGEFEFEMDFEVTEPRDAIEVNFTTLEGAIEGEFRLAGLVFRRA